MTELSPHLFRQWLIKNYKCGDWTKTRSKGLQLLCMDTYTKYYIICAYTYSLTYSAVRSDSGNALPPFRQEAMSAKEPVQEGKSGGAAHPSRKRVCGGRASSIDQNVVRSEGGMLCMHTGAPFRCFQHRPGCPRWWDPLVRPGGRALNMQANPVIPPTWLVVVAYASKIAETVESNYRFKISESV